MSLELVDARIKISQETDAVVEAIHRATGKERSEVMRDVLHEWALNHIEECNLVASALRARGLAGNVRD